MGEKPLIIRHGTLVTPYGLHEQDIWIEEGKINKLVGKPLENIDVIYRNAQEFDASDYYIFPGFINFLPRQASHYDSVEAYLAAVRFALGQGVTCLVDTIRLSSWTQESQLSQLSYLLTPHFNSPIDYAIRVNLDSSHFTKHRVRQLRDEGYRLLGITVRESGDLKRIDWDSLYPILHQSRMSVHLHIHNHQLPRDMRKELVDSWLHRCLYGKIRTLVEEADPLFQRDLDSFYLITQANETTLGPVIRHLMEHWYGYLPVICPADKFLLPLKRKEMNLELLLPIIVRLCSANVAKAIGCYPKKGSLLPGADADLFLVKKENWLTNFSLSTILNLSEVCLPNYVMAKGNWISLDADGCRLGIGKGKYIQKLTPYNYAI